MDNEIYTKLGEQAARIKALENEISSIREDQKQLIRYANHWKGGLFVVIGLGSFLMWVVTQWKSIINMLTG